jgi:hypothetical protein
LEQPILALLDTVLCEVVYSNVLPRKTHNGPIITVLVMCLYDVITVKAKCLYDVINVKAMCLYDVITVKVMCLYDVIRLSDQHTFSEGSNKKFSVRTYVSIGTVS